MPQDAPDKVIDIPGYGTVAFPASMGEGAINAAAAKLYREANPQEAPGSSVKKWVSKAVDWLPTAGGAVGGLMGGAMGAPAGGIGAIPGAVAGATLGGAAGASVAGMAHHMLGDKPDPTNSEAMRDVAGQMALQGGSELAGAGLVKGASAAAPWLMTKAVKPAYKTAEKAIKNVEVPRVVQTLLDEGINVTSGGIGKINTLMASTNKQLKNIIATSTAEASPAEVVNEVRPVMRKAMAQSAPSADKAAVRGVIDDFVASHGRDAAGVIKKIPVQRLQELKQGTYQSIGSRNFGETKGFALEAEKALARGEKKAIERAHPEVGPLNAREGRLIEAKDAVAKVVGQVGNRDMGGLAPLSSNPTGIIAYALSRSPAVKSMLARGLYKSAAKASGVPENVLRASIQLLASEDGQ